MRTDQQTADYRSFMYATSLETTKIQIGARGQKRGPDWLAVDLYDTSDIIDRNWDLHCLPIADNSVDCYVCNAVLEHVLDPTLALYEMFRTLRSGGFIWAEVPFLQYYHPSPGDYTRWTVEGLQHLFSDFTLISSGVSVTIGHEVRKLTGYLSRAAKRSIPNDVVESVEDFITAYEELDDHSPRLYSTAYVWGQKDKDCPVQTKDYFDWKRASYHTKHNLPYPVDATLSTTVGA